MADKNWWFNSAGAVAPVSNPGSAVPNYGLTMDVATAPWDESNPDYQALASSLAGVLTKFRNVTRPAPAYSPTLWDRATGVVGDLVGAGQAAVGAAAYGITSLDEMLGTETEDSEGVQRLGDEADERGLSGMDKYEYITEQMIGGEVEESMKEPGVAKAVEAMDTVTKYASAGILFASLSQDDEGFNLVGQRWAEAKEMAFDRGWSPGQAVMALGVDREILTDEERMDKIREHHTLFNTGALAFNVVAAWKADPTVLLGKGAGAVRNYRAGTLAKDGRAFTVQRDILSEPTREGAQAAARNYTGMADRVRAARGLSLYDKSLELREAAKTMGFEEFSKLGPFRPGYSANGTVMARLMQDAADNDADWNLIFRTSIGDTSAVGELIAKQGEYASKIQAVEGALPSLENQLSFIENRFNARLAEQGGKPGRDTQLIVTGYGDRFLNDEVTTLRAAVEEKRAELATFRDYDSFYQRALPGVDPDTGDVSRLNVNNVFNQLNQINPGKGFAARATGIKGSMYAFGGKVSTFRHDEYSPVQRIFQAPAKPFLKRVGVVNLTDVDEGGSAVNAYLDQIAYVTGKTDQGVRDHILSRWAGSVNDVERKEIVDQLERQGVALVAQRHGISGETMDLFAAHMLEKRGKAWGRMSDQSLYTTVKGKDGKSINRVPILDDEGNVLDEIDMPVSATELPNWRPLTNLTDLEKTIRDNRDVLKMLDEDLQISKAQANAAAVRRATNEIYTFIGESFNTYWKPTALLSLRWPARVVADESMRIMLFTDIASHMGTAMEGARNMVYNKGFVRPTEWWAGRDKRVRAIKTQSIAEDTLRIATEPFDAYDYRAVNNPTGAVPARALDLDQMDRKRYGKLNATAAERSAYTRTLGYYQGTAPKPKWEQQWDDRLADAEKTTKGFFFDPATDKAVKKGLAVSPYPGRLQTFGNKPTAKAMNSWVEKNSDLLAIKGNRAAVWLDQETGRWHLDVVKVAKTKADAARLADEVEAPDFYDIENGFTRYLDEENFYGHYSSPGAFEHGGFDAVKVANVDTPADVPKRAQRGVGFGTRKFKSGSGDEVEVERLYGRDRSDANVYFSLTSSKDMFQNLLGGYTRGLGLNRERRVSVGHTSFDPGDPKAPDFRVKKKKWEEAWSEYVNKHVRQDEIWLRMLNGQTDDQIESWLRTAKGRRLRERMGPRGVDPHKWVGEMRAIFDHTLPTARVREAARQRDIEPGELDDLIPHALRNDVHGEDILSVAGKGQGREVWNNFVARWYDRLGSMPTDALVRHPFAANMYELRMRNYLRSVDSDELTPQVLAAAEASSRAFALKQMRRLLYNIADDHEGVRMLRFVSPFFQAQVEVLERYMYLMARKPEAAARLGLLFNASQGTSIPGIFEVQDSEGNKAGPGFNRDNRVVLQVNDFWRGMANHIPGLKGALDKAGSVAIPTSSLNMIFQGEGKFGPIVPSVGPLVSIPASEFYFRERGEFATAEGLAGSIYRQMYPFGTPDGGNWVARTGKGLAPAWLRRAITERFEDFDDSAFANRVNMIHAANMLEWQKAGKQGPKPRQSDALEAAKAEYRLRAFSSFALPAPVTPQSPYQFWIDESRKFKDRYGLEAGEKFYDKYGAEYFAFYTESSKSNNGLSPTAEGKIGYDRNKKLIDQAPDLAGVLAGPFHGMGEFNDAVYQWQIETRKSPTSKETMREIKDPESRWKDMEIDRGWVEYGKLTAARDAELRRRGLTSVESDPSLKYWFDQEREGIIARNPAWQDAYMSQNETMGDWLQQAYRVAFEPELDGRADIEGLRDYLLSRLKIQDALQELQANGVTESDNLSAASDPVIADLAASWDSYVREITSRNLLFAEIYNRYLDGDDMTVMYFPEG